MGSSREIHTYIQMNDCYLFLFLFVFVLLSRIFVLILLLSLDSFLLPCPIDLLNITMFLKMYCLGKPILN